jgi:hypothetical protein
MSLENKIEALIAAIESLNRNICEGMIPMMTRQSLDTIGKALNVAPAAPVAPAPAPVVEVAPVVAAPLAQPAPVAAPVMPAPPAFVAPAPVTAPAPQATGGAPFNDGKGLIDYVMSAYKALGAAKGSQIQNVLVSLGYQNINDVKPEHYGALFAGVEALK